jgi:hypothetical protein
MRSIQDYRRQLIAIMLLLFLASCGERRKYDPQCDNIPSDRGPLIIKSGSTISLRAGGTYEYSSILVHKGGILEFVGDKPTWTYLKSKGNFRLEGTIRAVGYTDTSTAPKGRMDGIELKHDYGKKSQGGSGGHGGRRDRCATGSCFVLANLLGNDGTAGKGGKGGIGISMSQLEACDHASTSKRCKSCYLFIDEKRKDKNAHDKCVRCEDCLEKDTVSGQDDKLMPGMGYEGAGIGRYGGLLYIATCANFVGENGLIDVSGGKGKRGTDGQSNRYSGGGGAGGGPGGNGGSVYFNVSGNLSLPDINIQGGPGGEGGKGGVPHPLEGIATLKGGDGKKGNTGKMGAITICQGDCLPANNN